MRTPILLAALAALATPLAAHAQDRVVNVAPSDPAINAAVARAKRELPVFFAHVGAPGPGEDRFMIKYDVQPGAPVEFVWAEIISHANAQTVAKLINASNDGRFALGLQVRVNDAEIIDWGYFKDRVMQGSYTTRVLLTRMPEAEAAPFRQYLGW
jgi:uncharacterized protein YegJ (DUF2314 family)